ncbi:MAG: S8 family serine peptidase [Deltaproteobacteria bacterium]|nr:S8 family serine peptidase [Deltaproteobacteria bacterium]
MKKSRMLLGLVLFISLCLHHSFSVAQAQWININGTVTYNGTPVCAMVLANGKHVFTCSGDGSFNLGVPLDSKGQILVYTFCSGLAPWKQMIYPHDGVNMRIDLRNDYGSPGMDVGWTIHPIDAKWVTLSGTVTYHDTPVCAMVLANGQHMFSCKDNPGIFTLEVPLNADDEITLFTFASGFQPFKTILGPSDVSGTITAPDFAAIDGDTNDPYSDNMDNDTIFTAQEIGNPAIVGGFVCSSGTGYNGDRFANTSDRRDFYEVTLAAGQSITLEVSDYDGTNNPDLDLFLYDQNQTEVDSSELVSGTERVTVVSSGQYYIEVLAYRGASNYLLSVGRPDVAGQASYDLRIEHEFVPGEVLVRFKDDHLPGRGPRTLSSRAFSIGLQGKAGGPGRAMLFALPEGSKRNVALAGLGIQAESNLLGSKTADKDERDRRDTINVVKALRKRADVAGADLNYIYHPTAVPNDRYYFYQWHYPLINLPQAWDITTDNSNSVIVAVVDTGVYMAHEDLTANLTNTGYDFIRDTSRSNDGDGIDPNPDDPGDDNTPGRSSFHGTHVAGTIAAISNNSTGVAGVSWGSKIMPIRVIGVGGSTSYDIIQGVRYAAGLSNDSGATPSQAADIINLSLTRPVGSLTGGSSTEQNAYTEVRNAGTIIIAAAGNSETSTLHYPASYDGIVSVSAVDMYKDLAPYSNYGTAIDVAAPGGNTEVDTDGDGYPDGVLSTCVDDSTGEMQDVYTFKQGTSMASPHVAGVVALMKAMHPGLTPAQLDSALSSGHITEDLGLPGRDDTYGHGVIDALKAVQKASELAGNRITDPILSVSPSLLYFGSSYSSLTITVANGGGGALKVTNVSDNADWLSVTVADVDENGVGAYTASVDRSGLVQASYSADIRFTSNAGTDTIFANMTVEGAVPRSGDAGYHWIILIDPVTKDTYDTVQASNIDGSYSYAFPDVAPGEYFILGGTDSDNDGYICDPGEACGGYPTVELLAPVAMGSSDCTGLNFTTGFTFDLIAPASAIGLGPEERGFSKIPVGKEFENDSQF